MAKQMSILNTYDKKYRFFVNVSGKTTQHWLIEILNVSDIKIWLFLIVYAKTNDILKIF